MRNTIKLEKKIRDKICKTGELTAPVDQTAPPDLSSPSVTEGQPNWPHPNPAAEFQKGPRVTHDRVPRAKYA